MRNKLTTLPKSLADLRKLEYLYLDGNRFPRDLTRKKIQEEYLHKNVKLKEFTFR